MEINGKVYTLIPKVYKASSSTSNTGKYMKEENDILMMNNIRKDLSHRVLLINHREKTFSTITRPKLVEDIQNKTFDEILDKSDKLQRERVNTIIPSNMFDIKTRPEVIQGLKSSGHTDTITEASSIIDQC